MRGCSKRSGSRYRWGAAAARGAAGRGLRRWTKRNRRGPPTPAGRAARTAGRRRRRAGRRAGDWGPGRDMARAYSASRAAGGGVLRDLSHELDLATWLFGPWRRVAAVGGRLGSVTVDADDGWGILLGCEGCPVVTIELNSLDRSGRRVVTVQAGGETLRADLVASTLEIGRAAQALKRDRAQTHDDMHRALLDGSPDVCSFGEGERVVGLIEAIETAAHERRWIEGAAA